MVWKQFARAVISLALLCLPLAAQQPQEAPTHVTLQGVVQTPDKTPVPGASVHIVEQISGKSWITWTDEAGKFRLPELPSGKFHIDATQIGFGSDARDVAPTTEKSADIVMVLKVATAAEIANANAAAVAASTPAPTAPANGESAKAQAATTNPPTTPDTKSAAGAKPQTPKPGTTQTARNGRGGQPGQQGGRGGRGFSQVDVNGAGGAATDTNDQGGAASDSTGLGAAASSDALLVAGTTAQGATGGFPGMFGGMGGENGGDPNNPGMPVQSLGLPGQTGDNGGNPGGGGFPGGGGGGARGGGGPGGGRGGPGGGPGRGGRGGPGQNGVPWGLNSVIRKRINQMHYTLNETLLDSAFNARPWQANGQPQDKLPSSTNRFGGSLGGPLRIPHVYDGRDKTFFFLNVNIGHGDTANFLTGNVPTALERVGNFCSSGSVNPVTGLASEVDLFNFATSADPTNLRSPRAFLNPANHCAIASPINPTAAALLALIPMPNQIATPQNQNNFLLQVATPTNNQTVSMRVNQTLSPKLNFGVQYNLNQAQSSGQGLFPSETSSSSSRAQVVNLTFNQNITPKLINAIVLNFTRTRSNRINGFANNVNEEALLGIVGGSTNPFNFGLPAISFNNDNGGLSYSGFSDVIPNLTRNQTWNLTDTLSWTHGKHATHFGATYRRVQLNTDFDPSPRGTFTFTGLMTEGFTAPNQVMANTGSPIADFELGLPQGTSVQFGDSFNYLRSRGFIAYFTDDWKVKPRFTLTYGLRYELILPASELFGHLSDLDVNPVDFTQIAQITPGSVGPFSGALPNSLIRPNYKNFAPRVSIAWRVPGKYFEANNGRHALVVRAGYNIFDNSNAYGVIDNHLLNQAPFATNASAQAAVTTPLSIASGLLAATSTPSINSYAVNPNYRNPIVQIWNVSLESQFIDGFTWQISYIGTKGSYLDVYSAPNILNSANNALVASGGSLIIPKPLQFTFDSSGASSIYNALQLRLQKRMRNGFTFTTIYTYAKSIDDASSIGGGGQTVIQDFPNFSADRGLSAFDVRNTLTGNGTYELPFGERKRFAHKGAEARILGNWRLSGSATFRSGMPLQPVVQSALTAINIGGNLVTRPDFFAGCNQNLLAGQSSVSEFFNISCFAAPNTQFPASPGFPQFPQGGPIAPAGLIGNAGRDIIRGPGSMVVNMALAKSITLGRDAQRHLDLRWEVNNLANHPNYSSIGLVVGTKNFGEVLGAASMRTMQAVVRLNF